VPDTPLVLRCQDARLAASLARPEGTCRAAVAALHPADDPSRRQFLFEHLAMVLPERGVAVLRYDRRPAPPDRDVPYQLQAEDLTQGLAALAEATGPVPTGLWGFSQGAWVALLTAARRADIAFLVLVGCSAVSPARQMRYGTAEQLRRAGFGPGCLAELARLRRLRGLPARTAGPPAGPAGRGRVCRPRLVRAELGAARPAGGAGLGRHGLRPGREHRPGPLPGAGVLRRGRMGPGAGEHRRLAGRVCRSGPAGHSRARRDHSPPTYGGRRELAAISPEYTARLTGWLDDVIPGRD
jgi:uncharacterized protein